MGQADKAKYRRANPTTTVAGIEPIFDYRTQSTGHFNISLTGPDGESIKVRPFELSFLLLIDHQIKVDSGLYRYLKKKKATTASDIIYDLYDLGFPVDQWVVDYMDIANNNIDKELLNSMIKLFNTLKNFSSKSGSV